MWQSVIVSAVTLTQQHLLFSGLGGIIAVIVGGVVSAVALKQSKRAAVRPAPNPQPAPASRRPKPPTSYAEPAPPTSPARRLHPGPISFSEPPVPKPDEQDEQGSSLFNPDLFSAEPAAPDEAPADLATTTLPLLRPASALAEEWRAQTPPTPIVGLTHAPVWNRAPFAKPAAPDTAPSVFATPASGEPPIWRTNFLYARQWLSGAAMELTLADESLVIQPHAMHAPIWSSYLRPGAAEGSASGVEAAESATETEPPIWPSFLRPR